MAIGYGKCFLLRGRWTVISCDLELFKFKLLAVAQSDMCWISSGIDSELEAGTNRCHLPICRADWKERLNVVQRL